MNEKLILNNESWIEFQEGCKYNVDSLNYNIKNLCKKNNEFSSNYTICSEFYCPRLKKEL